MIDNVKLLKGIVISNKMHKTCVVSVERFVKHKIYGKFIKRNTRLKVHDEKNLCSVGDLVEISECRPISKSKSWKLIKVIKTNNNFKRK
ncbi:30S ribosomal protein S17 [Buchnera aphidicola]|uniref:30S ribosomal protein S17 n=1 Tax=Buchnera aphidicola TaxID=9 RepID=UPI0031B80686